MKFCGKAPFADLTLFMYNPQAYGILCFSLLLY